jgi:RNA polymerase subunit RPABC4/transcription elongation factor Spt4
MPKKSKVQKVTASEVAEELNQRDRAADETIDKRFVLNASKDMRACQFCKLLLTSAQWKKLHGCPNCRKSRGFEHTTDKFTGIIALIYSKQSWLAKWTDNQSFVTGAYAKQILRTKGTFDFDDNEDEYMSSDEEADFIRHRRLTADL